MVRVTEQEYTEPTNEQLANFMTLHARNVPGAEHLQVSPAILEFIFERDPHHRALALRKHREFQESVKELSAKILSGELQCEHILLSGKQCPNYNQPGHSFCGLHLVG